MKGLQVPGTFPNSISFNLPTMLPSGPQFTVEKTKAQRGRMTVKVKKWRWELRSFWPLSILLAGSERVLMTHSKSERERTRIHLHSSSIFFLLIQNLHIFTRNTNLRSLELASKQNQANVISISARREYRVNTQMQALGSALAAGA